MLPALEVKNLTKKYGNKVVVDNLSFSVMAGQIFGFVGPNGAGKSTTLKMIAGLTAPTEGCIYVNGYNIQRNFQSAMQELGAVIEIPQLYTYLSGKTNLKLFAKFYGKNAINRIDEIVALVGMENHIDEKVSTYSLGMKQRLGIAQALLNKPKLLILDEPTNGLDPDGIVEIRNILRKLATKEHIAIIISSHNLAELEQICDSVALINKGKLIDFKTMNELKNIAEANQKVQFLCNYPNYAALCLKKKYNFDAKVVGNSVILKLKEEDVANVVAFLTFKKVKIFSTTKTQKTLEELYFELLNKTRPSTSIL